MLQLVEFQKQNDGRRSKTIKMLATKKKCIIYHVSSYIENICFYVPKLSCLIESPFKVLTVRAIIALATINFFVKHFSYSIRTATSVFLLVLLAYSLFEKNYYLKRYLKTNVMQTIKFVIPFLV